MLELCNNFVSKRSSFLTFFINNNYIKEYIYWVILIIILNIKLMYINFGIFLVSIYGLLL